MKFHQVVLENLAKCHSIYKRYPEALEVMERALVVNPQGIDLLILRANLLGMSDQLKESRERLLEAKRIAEKKDDQENVDKVDIAHLSVPYAPSRILRAF